MTKPRDKAHSQSIETDYMDNILFGLPMWFKPDWRGRLLTDGQVATGALAEYAQIFESIEGNTTLYGLPSDEAAITWHESVPEHFRFCFKLPKSISHAQQLQPAWQQHGTQWLQFVELLQTKMGISMLQFPASFGPDRLSELWFLLDQLQHHHTGALAVEMRHPVFFAKGRAEQELLAGLQQRDVDRVMFDTRGLFHDQSGTAEVLEAQSKKPRLPLHPISTGKTPIVRFIGHTDWQKNLEYLYQWQGKLAQWLKEGRQPYFFVHTVSNANSPEFSRWIKSLWGIKDGCWPGESQPENASLF